MDFKQLYKFIESNMLKRREANKNLVAGVKTLKAEIKSKVKWVQDINFHPIECKEGDPFGHFECHGTQESRWEDPESWVVLITYDRNLNMCGRRYVWCKELMHTFDEPDGSVKEESEYRELLEEIELKPLNPSEKYISENVAKWMALLILCPKIFRDELIDARKNNEISDYEIAFEFRIPENIVKSLFSESYNDAYEDLISK